MPLFSLFHATNAHWYYISIYLPYTSTGSFCVFLCLSVVYLIVLNFVVFSYVVQLIVAQTRKKKSFLNHFHINEDNFFYFIIFWILSPILYGLYDKNACKLYRNCACIHWKTTFWKYKTALEATHFI